MRGKEVCRTLKEIRAGIARQNDIPWETEECGFKGECRGTCPRCEAEVRQLEEALAKRRRLCRAVALAGVAAGMVTALSGCSAVEALIDAARPAATPAPGEEIVLGEIAPADDPIDAALPTPEAGDVLLFQPPMAPDSVRRLADTVARSCGGLAAVFSGDLSQSSTSYRYALVRAGGEPIAPFVKTMNAALHGKGGGRDGFAQGSVAARREEIESFFRK